MRKFIFVCFVVVIVGTLKFGTIYTNDRANTTSANAATRVATWLPPDPTVIKQTATWLPPDAISKNEI